MDQFAILALMRAKPGKETALGEFLVSARSLVLGEAGTTAWYAVKLDGGRFGSSIPSPTGTGGTLTYAVRLHGSSWRTPQNCLPNLRSSRKPRFLRPKLLSTGRTHSVYPRWPFRKALLTGIGRYSALPLRFIGGYGFLIHGVAKWSKGPLAFAAILHAADVPAPHLMARTTIAVEVLAGVALLFGAFVRLVSIPAIILLVVAIVTVHLPNGFSSIKLLSYTNGRAQFGPPGYEGDLLYIACIGALALMGPSPWSVDALLRREDAVTC
jgi:putative oxidoreductase